MCLLGVQVKFKSILPMAVLQVVAAAVLEWSYKLLIWVVEVWDDKMKRVVAVVVRLVEAVVAETVEMMLLAMVNRVVVIGFVIF